MGAEGGHCGREKKRVAGKKGMIPMRAGQKRSNIGTERMREQHKAEGNRKILNLSITNVEC